MPPISSKATLIDHRMMTHGRLCAGLTWRSIQQRAVQIGINERTNGDDYCIDRRSPILTGYSGMYDGPATDGRL